MKFPRRKREQDEGFTLIEMIVVLLVISAVMLIALPDLRASGEKGQLTACEANQRLIRSQLDNYYLDNQNQYPGSEEDGDELDVLVDEKYLQSRPSCPAKGEYTIVVEERGAGISCSVHGVLGQ